MKGMVARVSKSIKKLVLVKAVLEQYAGDKLTNAELIKFADTLISLADEEFDDGVAREYSQSVNYYSREVDRMIGTQSFYVFTHEFDYLEIFEGGCRIEQNMPSFKAICDDLEQTVGSY